MKKQTLIIIYAYQGANEDEVIFANLKNKELESASITEYHVQGMVKRVIDLLGLNILACQKKGCFPSRAQGLETLMTYRETC
ncbi:hypothetical protein CHH60_07755 [Paenibacillus sp. 7523-1]|nr:hypothetical protein CHH60_07755 [Paenibacillus sp. 7523-1]